MNGHQYTPEEIGFLRENIKGISLKDITRMFNERFGLSLKETQIESTLARKNIHSGRTGRFEKGNVPLNKGTHIGGWEPTQFKKGNRPKNYRPVGSERLTVDGYIEVKIADPGIWRPKHVVIWEAVNGPVPKGYVLLFADGNGQNVTIDNLLLVSRAQLGVLNHRGLLKKSKELNEAAVAVATLVLKIGEVKKRGKKNGQC